MTRCPATIFSCVLLLAAGCGKMNDQKPVNGVRLDLDREDERSFVEYYFGPYAPAGSSLSSSEFVNEVNGSFFLDVEALSKEHIWASELDAAASDGTITWDELSPFLSKHYYEVIDPPATLADFLAASDDAEIDWMEVEVDGVMTNARRHVLIPERAVRQGLEDYVANGEQLLYAVGTRIVADHVFDNQVEETTAMQKRADGYWDFFVFDKDGELARSTTTPPKELTVPTQCAGCHLGKRLYEPEKSFPGAARPGPEGPRAIHVAERFKKPEAVHFLDEHSKRSDGILGLYGTIYLSKLLAARENGAINRDNEALLEKLGL